MDLGLRNKAALVFGAGGGLGGAIARSLALEGARIVLADIRGDAADAVADDLRASGAEAVPLQWDLADIGAISAKLAEAVAAFGPIDVLVNNTGGPPPGSIVGQDPAAWRSFFDSMVLSVMTVTDQVLPGMQARGWGRVITSASSGVVAPIPNLGISNTLRLALVGWSKTLAREVGPHGITCNIVLPGRVATPRITSLDEQKARRESRSLESVAAESAASIALGRYGDPKEYGEVVAFLASERASYVTGSVVRIDGGYIPSI